MLYDESIHDNSESDGFAAWPVYEGREITVILGGHDRGIDLRLQMVREGGHRRSKAVICLGR